MALVKKLLKIGAVLVVVLVLAALAGIYCIGAWNIVFPSNAHETVPPEFPDDLTRPAILMFTKTNQFRHKEAIKVGSAFFKELAAERGWSIFHTENGATFNGEDLARFDVVLFHNTSGDTLSVEQELAFQAWLEAGGGWVGLHAAGDGSHTDWPWYMKNLIGADFTAHIMGPQFQVADVHTEALDHPVMSGMPAIWQHEEEWYSWEESPRPNGFTILSTVDEDSYTPVMAMAGNEVDLRMGDHPVMWSNCVGQGRTVYSALGHQGAAFAVPDHQRFLENALVWAMNREGCVSGEQQ